MLIGMITIAETEPFQKKASKLLSLEEREELVTYLAEYPTAGVLIQGAGGIRKLRWAREGGEKSGGFRIIYYFHSDTMPLYLLAMFGKNEKANISTQEKNLLAKAVSELTHYWKGRNE
jgi:hypothetical protein